MAGDSTQLRKAQLDTGEREHLEDVVTEMRERIEANVRFQLEEYDLEQRPGEDASPSDEHENLVEAIELEAADRTDWDEGYERYVTSVGYTVVNRLAALRCLEVRGFVDEEVTVFREDGLTPAADRLVAEEFMLEEEAVLEAYRNACDDLADEIEILFDRDSAYSLLDPDHDAFTDLCGMLDEVPDAVWRADDVLGWVYEYYNTKELTELRRKARDETLEPNEVAPANQFYTPHWVVRMLTDNSLGKLYLESNGTLDEVVDSQDSLTPAERKERSAALDDSPEIADLCTYLIGQSRADGATEFESPEELRVIDPACGSGHFLLYAFDVLERIWRAERPDLDPAAIPRLVLEHNLHGVDVDVRACQLTAFNLYLKARTRAEQEGRSTFEMPDVGVVCADARIADVDDAEAVFDSVAGDRPEVREVLQAILESFEESHGLGSLLDVRGVLSETFDEGTQLSPTDSFDVDHTLHDFLQSLREEIARQKADDSFLARDLKSFVKLIDVLTRQYDVALMNPPYGSKKRMPDPVQDYVGEHYSYSSEYYVNFFEACDRLTAENGRIGMLVPRTFMFKDRYEEFRSDFVGAEGSFDFLAEFGLGVLDNATVRTAGTVVRSGLEPDPTGTFIRLHDLDAEEKEETFLRVLNREEPAVDRRFEVDLGEFERIPRTPICYSVPSEIRALHDTDTKLDAEGSGVDGESAAVAVQGLATANDARFTRYHWETEGLPAFKPIAKGGSEAWILPQVSETVAWGDDGTRLKRSSKDVRTRNEEWYGKEGLTWTYVKSTGRRFGYYPKGGLFSVAGFMLFPRGERSLWTMLSILNSDLYHCFLLSQVVERFWNAGEVGSLPWYESLAEIDALEALAREQYRVKLAQRVHDPVSPYYAGPALAPDPSGFAYSHPHASRNVEFADIDPGAPAPDRPIVEAARDNRKAERRRERRLEALSERIDERIYSELGISEETQEAIREEIFYRTSEKPEDRNVPGPETVPEIPDDLEEQVKNLVHHFAVRSVRETDDGIVPVTRIRDRPGMVDRVVERFRDAYGEYADDRLAEVDDVLGGESATDEAYPNLRSFVENDLFEYHVDAMENAPILWKLGTNRLLADAEDDGFACFLDYHQLDGSLLDRISNRYLEPRKADLRERRSAANQRRNDGSLSASERAEATAAFEFCSNALEQIAEFEAVLQELGSPSERDFGDDGRELVGELAPKVATFREETARRIDALVELRERNGEAWFQETFSENFWAAVDEWRDEWLDALDELERACEEYAKPSDEPVAAHLADLFDYFNWRLKGSDHYSSTGILFTTYYFEREAAPLLDEEGEPDDHLQDDERKLASLAEGLEDPSILDGEYLDEFVGDDESKDDVPPLAEYKALAEEIGDRCRTISGRLPSDWTDRALSEVTTAGYRPRREHGVAINVTPLAEKSIVPEIVEDRVL